jgi:hypothetical protein
MPELVKWETPIRAHWQRSCGLRGLRLESGLVVELQEYIDEENRFGAIWRLTFHPLFSFRWTTEELNLVSLPLLSGSGVDGAFFLVNDSD